MSNRIHGCDAGDQPVEPMDCWRFYKDVMIELFLKNGSNSMDMIKAGSKIPRKDHILAL
jgi:hypothetical protein